MEIGTTEENPVEGLERDTLPEEEFDFLAAVDGMSAEEPAAPMRGMERNFFNPDNDARFGYGEQTAEDQQKRDLASKENIKKSLLDVLKAGTNPGGGAVAPILTEEEKKTGKAEFKAGAESASIPTKLALSASAALPQMGEDLYNFTADFVNEVNDMFGGDPNLLQNTTVISDALPRDGVSEFTREGAKFLIGYAGIHKMLQGVNWLSKSKFGIKGSEAMAGFLSEMIFAGPEAESMTQSFIKLVPGGHNIIQYIEDPDDSNLERRAKAAVFGLFEGVMAEKIFHAFSALAKTKKITKTVGEIENPEPSLIDEAIPDIPRVYEDPNDTLESLNSVTTDLFSAGLDKPELIEAGNTQYEQLLKELSEVNTISPENRKKIEELVDRTNEMVDEADLRIGSKAENAPSPRAVTEDEFVNFQEMKKRGEEIKKRLSELQEASDPNLKQNVEDIPVIPREDLPPIPEADYFKAEGRGEVIEGDFKNLKQAIEEAKPGEGLNEVQFFDKDGNKAFLNTTKIRNTNDIRLTISKMIEQFPERYSVKRYSEADIQEMADAHLMDKEEFLKWTRDSGLQMGHIKAAMDLTNHSVEVLKEAFRKYNAGEISEEAGLEMYASAMHVVGMAADMRSMWGVLGKEAQMAATKSKQLNLDYYASLRETYGSDFKAAAAEAGRGGFTLQSLKKSLQERHLMPVADRLVQARYAWLLSNPATHLRNLYGGMQTTLIRPGETFLAATINAVQRNPRGVHFGEAYHEMIGMAQGFMEASMITYKKLTGQGGEGVLAPQFLGVDPNHSKLPQFLQEAAPEPSTVFGKGIKFFDEQLFQGQFVGKLLVAEDNFMKHINARMTLNREAYRKGKIAMDNGMSPEQAQNIIKLELSNPSDATKLKMYKDAEYNTFTNEIEGPFNDWMRNTVDNPVGRIVAPFARVNINSLNYKLERIPGANLLVKNYRKQLQSADPSIRQRAWAKMAFASTTLTALGSYFHGTDSITGTMPFESKKWAMFEQTGQIPGAIKVGNEWIEYRSETPVGGILETIANIAKIRDLSGNDEDFLNDVGTHAVMLVANTYNPEFLTETTSKIFEAMSAGDSQKMKKLLQAGTDVASQFLPYSAAWRQAQRQLTDAGKVKRQTYDPNSHMKTFWNEILNVYAPERLAVKRNILGDPIYHKEGLGPDIVSPFGVGKEVDDPVIQELGRLSGASYIANPSRKFKYGDRVLKIDSEFITIQMPSRSVETDIVDEFGKPTRESLRPSEYEKLVQFTAGIDPQTGKGIGGGNTLKEELAAVMSSKDYLESSFAVKGIQVSEIMEAYQEVGRLAYKGTQPTIMIQEALNKKLREIREKSKLMRDIKRRKKVKVDIK